jgi:acetamidase/formamidase
VEILSLTPGPHGWTAIFLQFGLVADDGGVCGSAVETSMRATIRLTVLEGSEWIVSPHYSTSEGVDGAVAEGRAKWEYAAMGVHEDLREASRTAVRSVIGWLVATKALTREEAYVLCSVAGDLKIVEAVDMPHYAVAFHLSLSIFVDE